MKILYPSSINWFFMFQRPQQLLRSLARFGHEVHFINKKVNLPGAKNPTETVKPYKDLPLFVHPEMRPTEKQINELECDTLYYTFPPAGNKAMHFYDFDKVIFDSVDEPDGVFSFWNEDGAYYKALDSADYVIASAQRLLQNARKYNKNVILLPNACDYDFFIQKQRTPVIYEDINKPIVLYSGAIATWVDVKLLEKCSNEMPEYQFVCIGAEMNDQINKKLNNLIFLGHQEYKDVPSYVQHADVCIIPFKANQLEVKSCNPIKLWEFFACGKPVVTTAMPETHIDGVLWSRNTTTFKGNIKRAIEDDTEDNKNKRRIVAKKNSWDIRAQDLLNWID